MNTKLTWKLKVLWYKLRVLNRMKVVVWRLASKRSTVRGESHPYLETYTLVRTSCCRGQNQEKSFFAAPFYMLLWLRSLAAIRSTIWSVRRKEQTRTCKSNKKISEKFNNCFNKQEIKGSNNCIGEYKNVCEIEKKMFVAVLIRTS